MNNHKFKASQTTLSCDNHSAGTFSGGIGNFNLGLPKGFNRIGPMDKTIQKSNIRLLDKLPEYDVLTCLCGHWRKTDISLWLSPSHVCTKCGSMSFLIRKSQIFHPMWLMSPQLI